MRASPPSLLSHRPPGRPGEGGLGREAGYNLVMLMVAVTVLNIMVAISLPMWTEVIRRDKEEELISRGFQYIEAIRVFKNRYQRLPVRLEELIEVKPRCIRRLWKDPMTDGGKFQPIFENEGQPIVPPPQGQTVPPGKPDEQNPPGGENPPVATGPIVGVRSRSHDKSFLVFTGKEHYDEWRFTLELALQAGGQKGGLGGDPGGGRPPGATLNLSTRWIGRPLSSLVQAPNPPNNQEQSPPQTPPKRGGGRAPHGEKL